MVKGSNVPGNIALLISRYIFFYNKVFNYKVLSFHGILTHIEFQQFFHQIGLSKAYLFQTHIFSDKMLEFIG